jgi:hypothetical protein
MLPATNFSVSVRRVRLGTNVATQVQPFWSGLKSTNPPMLVHSTDSTKFKTKTVASDFFLIVQTV